MVTLRSSDKLTQSAGRTIKLGKAEVNGKMEKGF